MAKINTKVAIIGIIVLVLLVGMIGGALFVQSWRKSPTRYAGKAQAMLEDLQAKPIDLENEDLVKEYEKAAGYYVAAFNNTKDVEKQVGYLEDAIGVLEKIEKWDSIVGCWNKMITVDATNWQARRNIIDYLKKRAESGEVSLWSHVESNITELFEAQENAGVETDPYLYFVKGKAMYFSGVMGMTADSKTTLAQAIELMEKGIEQAPQQVTAVDYDYLAKAILALGRQQENTGVLNAMENAKKKAHDVIGQYISKNPNDPNGYVYDLGIDFTGTREEIEKLENRVLELKEKFPNSAAVYYAHANYYNSLGKKQTAVEKMLKANELNPKKIDYIIGVSKLAFDNYTISGDEKYKNLALEYGNKALAHPDAKETNAITKAANRNRKLNLHNMMALFYIELALDEEKSDIKDEYVEKAQSNIYQIKQMVTSPESVMVMKWDGLYNLASGNIDQAKIQLYKAYEKLKTSQQSDAYISYNLAKLFENTNEQGLFLEFINDALKQQDFLMTRPQVLLDYIGILTRMAPAAALNGIQTYESLFGSNETLTAYKFNSYLATNQIEKAQDILSEFSDDDPNKITGKIAIINNNINQNMVTRSQLSQNAQTGDENAKTALVSVEANIKRLEQEKNDLIEKLLFENPKNLSMANYSEYYNYNLAKKEYEKAENAAQIMAAIYPDNIVLQSHIKRLQVDDPNNITEDQSRQMAVEVFENISDPIQRNLSMGEYYLRSGQKEKAVENFNNVIAVEPNNVKAIVNLFDIAMTEKDMERLAELAQIAQEHNIDGCEGLSYSARIDTLNQDYDSALEKLNKCIEEKPLDSLLYYLRSKVHLMNNDFENAVEDARTASQYSPFNPAYSKNIALITYQRNQNLGDNATTEQRVEARNAIQTALTQNKSDMQLLSLYVDSIGNLEPEKAIAILQGMQAQNPTVSNDVQIGMLAVKLATESSPALGEYMQNALFEIAESSLTRAMQAAPDNQDALKLYVRVLQETDRDEQAQKLLENDNQLLWQFYYQNGQYAQAKEILDRLYSQNPTDQTILNGLVLIAEQTENKEDVIKYTNELIKLDGENLQNHLMQIRSYIQVNLIDQAKEKIDSLIERGKDDPRIYLLDALVQMRKSKLDKALETTKKALVSDPESPQGWRLKGQINAELGNFEQAIEDLKKSKALAPSVDVRISLAQAYMQTNQRGNAIAELESAVENPQAPIRAWLILEDIYRRGESEYEINNFYNKASEKFVDSPIWFNRYAQYASSKEYYLKAAELYKQGWDISGPDGNIDSFTGYMDNLIKAGNHSQAVSFASRHIDDNYAIPALLYIGYAKYDDGDTTAAREFLSKAIDRSENSYPNLSNCINMIRNSIDQQLAKDMITQRYQQNPQSSHMNFAMFLINLNDKQHQKALDYVEKSISLADQASAGVLSGYKLSALQQAYSDTKKDEYFSALINEYKKVYQKSPNNPEVLNNLSYMLATRDMELDNAKEYAERAMELAPNQPGIMDTYAYILLKTGENEKALEILIIAKQLFEKASANAPVEFYDHYGMANEKTDNDEIALISYKKAIELNDGQLTESEVQRIKQSINKLENK